MTFDLMVFDREVRKHHPEIKSYDLQMPKTFDGIVIRAVVGGGYPRPITISGKELVAWGVVT